MLGVALLTLAERKVSAWMQDRHGPNRVLKGWGQPIADGIKNFVKEETYPAAANLPLFILAPVLSFIPALVTWAVIPFAAPWGSRWGVIEMVLAPMPVGFLFILAISSLGVYGIVLAGWASNNKYALLGGLRSSAQMISYEIAMGMSTIPVLLLAGNVSMSAIVNQQAFQTWNVLNLTIAFFIFLVAAFAETNRLPFDLPEAESELITGYHTEYSAMKFSMFFIAEYANMVTASALMATLFFGGWDIPFTLWDNVAPHTGIKTLLTLASFAVKTLFFVFFYMWIRWTLPRFRYDQLMSLGWKILLPLALGYIVVIAGAVVLLEALGFAPGSVPYHAGLIMLNLAAVVILFMILDRGRLISPAYSRLNKRDLAKLRAVSAPHRAPLLPESGD
jgi:NADH-quinone oxidoreductase subunit H